MHAYLDVHVLVCHFRTQVHRVIELKLADDLQCCPGVCWRSKQSKPLGCPGLQVQLHTCSSRSSAYRVCGATVVFALLVHLLGQLQVRGNSIPCFPHTALFHPCTTAGPPMHSSNPSDDMHTVLLLVLQINPMHGSQALLIWLDHTIIESLRWPAPQVISLTGHHQ